MFPKLIQSPFYYVLMCLKIAGRMETVASDLGLHCLSGLFAAILRADMVYTRPEIQKMLYVYMF